MSPIHCSTVFVAGKERAEKGYRISKRKMLLSDRYRSYKSTLVLSQMEDFITQDSQGKFHPPKVIHKLRSDIVQKWVQEKNEEGKSKVDLEYEKEILRRSKYSSKYTRPSEADDMESVYLYLGDEFGLIKVWDLTLLLHKCKFEPEVPFLETDLQFYPGRVEKIDVSGYAQSIVEQCSLVDPSTYEEIDPDSSGIVLMEVLAHKGPVKHLSFSRDRGLISCGDRDRKVRVWNPLTMDLDGIINQTNMKQDCKWKKKQNENQNRFADVNLMQKVLSEFNMKDRQIELVSEAES